jgi:hypothetical protein
MCWILNADSTSTGGANVAAASAAAAAASQADELDNDVRASSFLTRAALQANFFAPLLVSAACCRYGTSYMQTVYACMYVCMYVCMYDCCAALTSHYSARLTLVTFLTRVPMDGMNG